MGLIRSVVRGASKVGKIAAPILAMTGVGAPLAAGIELASQVGDKATSPGGLKKTKLLKDLVLPTAGTYAAGAARPALSAASPLKAAGKTSVLDSAIGLLKTNGKLDVGKLAKAAGYAGTALTAAKSVGAASKAGKSADSLTDEFVQNARQSRDMAQQRYAATSSLLSPALDALKARIAAGPRATPNITSIGYDSANPFRNRFGGRDLAAAGGSANISPAIPPAPIAPPMQPGLALPAPVLPPRRRKLLMAAQ